MKLASPRSGPRRLRVLVLVVALLLIAAAAVSVCRLRFETDILKSLPRGNPVMEDGARVLAHHPYQNRIFIDLGADEKQPDRLVAAARFVEERLRQSGLFQSVGTKEMGRLFPHLLAHVTGHLPVLFTAEELEKRVAPILEEGNIDQKARQHLSRLFTMESMGRSTLALQDPLALRNLVLAEFKHLVAGRQVRFYKGQLLSADGRHTLVLADPKAAGTGAEPAHRIDDTIKQTAQALAEKYQGSGPSLTMTPVGAYRAVVDNEAAAKHDTKNALLFATIGIACLLMLAFPRPYIGLLAFVPAAFGTVCALAFYALWHSSISVMTIGFGGAIISITVDHGISYLLFLDRPHPTRGKEVCREVRAVALLAALSSVGAFFTLSFSGFPILSEIGQFAAYGIAFSFLFVHSCFPLLFPSVKAARHGGKLFLQRVVDRMATAGGRLKPAVALVFLVVMAFFADPDFNVDLSSMNTVQKETVAAEKLISKIWGQQLFDRVYLMVQAPDLQALQQKSDRLAAWMDAEIRKGTIAEAFVPSEVFPGKQRCRQNLAAWREFWQQHDRRNVERQIRQAAASLGMPGPLFDGVYQAKNFPCSGGLAIAPEFREIIGIHHMPGTDSWMVFTALTPGPEYHPERFFSTYSAKSGVHVFDPDYYSQAIGNHLSRTFVRMLVYIAASVTILLLLFFMDPVLTAAALLPVGFAMICTLGVLSLIGLPLNIAGLMLSVVVIGMGLDYSLYMVRAAQRYRDPHHHYQSHIRMTVFLAGTSTLIGFGALALGEHNLMKSLGRVLVPGIGFVMAGTFSLLPPLLAYLFRPAKLPETPTEPGSRTHQRRIRALYRHMEAYPRLFSWFKRRMDPMFSELPELIGHPSTIIDIGCGYGVTAAWIRAMNPSVAIYGADPDPERARIANRLVTPRGRIYAAGAPDLPDFSVRADVGLMIDMVHYLPDTHLAATLQRLRAWLKPGAVLLIRATIPQRTTPPLLRRIERLRNRMGRIRTYYRSEARLREILRQNGFAVKNVRASGAGREEKWFAARAPHQKAGASDD